MMKQFLVGVSVENKCRNWYKHTKHFLISDGFEKMSKKTIKSESPTDTKSPQPLFLCTLQSCFSLENPMENKEGRTSYYLDS